MLSKSRIKALKINLTGYAPKVSKSNKNGNIVRFTLQYNLGNELEWHDIGKPKTIASDNIDNLFTWEDRISENELKNTIRLHLQGEKKPVKFRVLVSEYEQYLNSDNKTVERLVYADEVGLAIDLKTGLIAFDQT